MFTKKTSVSILFFKLNMQNKKILQSKTFKDYFGTVFKISFIVKNLILLTKQKNIFYSVSQLCKQSEFV